MKERQIERQAERQTERDRERGKEADSEAGRSREWRRAIEILMSTERQRERVNEMARLEKESEIETDRLSETFRETERHPGRERE